MKQLVALAASVAVALLVATGAAAATGSTCKLARIEEWPVRVMNNQLLIAPPVVRARKSLAS